MTRARSTIFSAAQMMTSDPRDGEPRIQPRSLEVRKAAARVAVTASKKTGRPVSPDVKKLAET